jgi:hypothetical protein
VKPSSAKAKGRRLQQKVVTDVCATFNLPPEDVSSTAMGQGGTDTGLSTAALAVFPYATECKNQESLNIWKAINQAEAHATQTGHEPLVIFKRNRSGIYAISSWKHLLDLRLQIWLARREPD